MEAWLNRAPVLVHARCAVTHDHTLRSQGGLYFADFVEFAGALDWLNEHETWRIQMGLNGRKYVTDNFNWEAVVRRFEAAVAMWLPN
jgi:glycosyltransferase involved in cell wall biosynthesis